MREEDLKSLVVMCLRDFYSRRLLKLQELRINTFLARKNPYLLKAVGISTVQEIINKLLSDFVAASDETMFRDAVLEPIARVVSGGRRSKVKGIHFVISTAEGTTGVALRSGINTMNSGQIERQAQQLAKAGKELAEKQKPFDMILGHAYGRNPRGLKENESFRELSGQTFWRELTGEPDFYLRLVELMQDEPDQHRKEYAQAWRSTVEKLSAEFECKFCMSDGSIDWGKIVDLVSRT